jgi:hypothetical protein
MFPSPPAAVQYLEACLEKVLAREDRRQSWRGGAGPYGAARSL